LPEHVHLVRARGRDYYYWQPFRGAAEPGERIRLPDAKERPAAFFKEVERLRADLAGTAPEAAARGTIANMVARFRASSDYQDLAPKTRSTYDVHLNRFAADPWGPLGPRDLTAATVLIARDAQKETPVMANQMLSVGRTLYDWAIPLDGLETNPFDKVKPLEIADRGHIPWPRWVVDDVLAAAPEDIRRTVILARMTCQRESDLVRMGPAHRENLGIWCRAKKTKRRRRSFFIPLITTDALELDRWAKTPIVFTNPRWKAPIARENAEQYIFSPTGKPYSTDGLRARWGRWLATDAGKGLAKRWRAWLAECVKRYEWDIDPEDARGPTLHGLRGAGILLRHAAGFDVDQIANDIGMSRPMVIHYMRFKDQMEVAAAGERRLSLVKA
jgi:hypothetical protein